jgi:hypothetical protein
VGLKLWANSGWAHPRGRLSVVNPRQRKAEMTLGSAGRTACATKN